MVYRSRRGSRRGYRKTRPVGRRMARTKRLVDGGSVLSRAERMVRTGANTAATVATLARSVGTIMSMINTEKKYIDTSYLNQPIDNTGSTFWLTSIAQGDNDSQRNGNQLLASDLTVRYTLGINSNWTVPCTYRVAVIVDKEFDAGTFPSIAQLFEDSTNPLSSINRDYSKRFVMIKSAVYVLNTTSNPSVSDKLYVKTPYHIFYDGATNTSADAKENQIFLVVWSDNDNIDQSNLNFYSRLNYYDN